MSFPTVHCTNAALDQIFTQPERHPELYNIIHNHANLVVDVDDDELFRDPYLKVLAKRPNFDTIGDKEFFDEFEAYEVEQMATDIFILNREQTECKQFRDKYGVCVLSEAGLDEIKLLKTSFKKQLEYNQENVAELPDGRILHGWRSVLYHLSVIPMNAMIIIDDYLFANSIKEGTNNLIGLLDATLPKSLDVNFELLIVTSNENVLLKPKNLEAIQKQIIAEVERPYEIGVSIATHKNNPIFHKRAIITNYHMFVSDQGFDAFREAKTRSNNDIQVTGAYLSVTDKHSDPEYKFMNVQLKSVATHLKKRPIGQNYLLTDLYFGDCQNRLLRDFTK